MTKPTPGPWTNFDNSSFVFSPERLVICKTSDDGGEDTAHANARLIAAAPLLLKELKALVARCDGEEGVQPDGSNMNTLSAHVAIQLAEEGNTTL